MDTWVQAFLLHLENKNFSANTVKSYRADLQEFTDYLSKRKQNTLEAFTSPVIRSFLASLPQDYARNTVLRKIAALRSLAAFLLRQGKLARNPFKLLPAPKREKLLPKFLTLPETDRLINTAGNTHFAARDKALFELMYSSGLRRSEVTGLKIRDVDFFNGVVRVLGKGNKERFVYFGSACRKAIDAYLVERNEKVLSDNRALFGSRDSNRISVTAVHRLVKKALLQAGLDSTQFSAHKLRHTAATMMLSGGVDVKTVQEVLGHENLNTTQIYTHIENTELKIAAEANPLSKLDFSNSDENG